MFVLFRFILCCCVRTTIDIGNVVSRKGCDGIDAKLCGAVRTGFSTRRKYASVI